MKFFLKYLWNPNNTYETVIKTLNGHNIVTSRFVKSIYTYMHYSIYTYKLVVPVWIVQHLNLILRNLYCNVEENIL